MGKSLFIAEKPSVANEFAKALKQNYTKKDGYLESEESVVTWCVGHLVSMSYPEVYDPALKRWSFNTIPFIPDEYKYEVISSVSKQFGIVKRLLCREDVTCIYVCTDSGREGEYIYRLVDRMAQVPADKERRRVWIDSQTEEEVLRGIREAKPLSEYDNLSDAAYLRAKEDYLMGINFSRALTLKYGTSVGRLLGTDKPGAISVGRVMTCVLGMVVRREREIRDFVKTNFFRVIAGLSIGNGIDAEFKAVEGSRYYGSPALYKDNGFKEKEDAEKLIAQITGREGEEVVYTPVFAKETDTEPSSFRTDSPEDVKATITSVEKKKENKNAPLLFNLAELQNECSKLFKISPDETLNITQELYEKKLVTYPRTDARVLSTAVAKEIDKNIAGLRPIGQFNPFVEEILAGELYKGIAKTRYTNDKQITDHYAIIPTGQGLQNLASLKPLAGKVYELIGRRFLSIFYPAAVYKKLSLGVDIGGERFTAGFKALVDEGWMKVNPYAKGKQAAAEKNNAKQDDSERPTEDNEEQQELGGDAIDALESLKKGMELGTTGFAIKLGETSPPKRYNSGSIILAMENAGQLIEDEELRAQIKSSGIGTSATRAEILNKLVKINYIALNKKTQIITPTMQGELIYEVVNASIRALLNPDLTASWEKGLTMVSQGEITQDEYMDKLKVFVAGKTNAVKTAEYNQYLNHNLSVVIGLYASTNARTGQVTKKLQEK